MTNLRKCLSVSAFAFLALAFCGLMIGQAVMAGSSVRAVNTGNSVNETIPLPTVESRGGSGSALSTYSQGLTIVDHDAIFEPAPRTKVPMGAEPLGIAYTKDGGEDLTDATDISGPLPITEVGTTEGNTYDLNSNCGSYDGAPDETFAFTAVGPGGGPFQYVDLSLCNSGYDTKVWVVHEATGDIIACNDDYCPGYRSAIPGLILEDGETYIIVIGGWSPGDFGDFVLELTAGPDPFECAPGDTPEGEVCGTHINDGPAMEFPAFGTIADGETICGTMFASGDERDGDYYQYEVTSAGGEELTFTCASDFGGTWYMMLMDEAAAGYYTYEFGGPFETVQIPHFYLGPGIYTIRVTPNLFDGFACGDNPADIVNGQYRYKLSLDVLTPEPKDDCALAEEIFDGVNDFTLDAGVWTFGPGGFGWGLPNVWFTYEATDNGIVTFLVCPDQFIDNDGGTANNDYFAIGLFKECYGSFLGIDRNTGCPDGAYCDYDCAVDGPFTVSGPILDGTTLVMEMLSRFDINDYSGTITVDLLPLAADNDFCVNAEDLGSGDVVDLFIHNFAASDDGWMDFTEFQGFASRCAVGDMGADVWYTWTATMDGWATVSTCDPGGFDGKLEIYEGFTCTNVEYRLPVACGDDDCDREGNGVMAEVEFPVTVGSEWLIRMGGWGATAPEASQGTSYMNVWESATAYPRPANDNCADITPMVLVDGVESINYGDAVDGSNHDCLMLAPTVWEAFTIDFCANVVVSYCPTENTDPNPGGYTYVTDRLLLTDCPCMGAIWTSPTDYDYDCTGGHRYEEYDALVPGTYYFPILPGWEEGPIYGTPGSGNYGLGVTATAIECVYCDAPGNLTDCEVSGGSWIEDVTFATISNLGTGCHAYEDFTAMTTTLYRGIDYDISVVMGKNGIAGEFDIADVWYDWNQNSGFLDIGDRTTLSRLALTWTATVSVPLDAMGVGEGATGFTLMRVRMASTADGGNGACGERTWGETEDYVVIIEDLPCGDLDGDGDTDGEDIAALIAAYTAGDLSGLEYWQTADIDGDGMITLADVVALVNAVYNGGDLICL